MNSGNIDDKGAAPTNTVAALHYEAFYTVNACVERALMFRKLPLYWLDLLEPSAEASRLLCSRTGIDHLPEDLEGPRYLSIGNKC